VPSLRYIVGLNAPGLSVIGAGEPALPGISIGHNGTIAFGAFLFLLWHLFRRGRRMYAAGNPFGLFGMVTLMVTVVLLSYDLPFESALPLLALCFSGVSAMESSPKLAPNPIAARAPRLRVDRNNKTIACGAGGADACES